MADPVGPVLYAEKLRTPRWWYVVAVFAALLLAVEFALAVSGWVEWVPFVVLVPLSIGVVLRLSSARLLVSRESLAIAGNVLPLNSVDRVIGLSPTELRRLVGRHSDPLAFDLIRSWIGPGLQLVLKPGSAVPYWVISTRHPAEVLDVLRGASVTVIS